MISRHKWKSFLEFSPILIFAYYFFVQLNLSIQEGYLFAFIHYISFGLIFISGILFFVNRKVYRWFLAVTLLLGVMNILRFAFITHSVSFGIGFGSPKDYGYQGLQVFSSWVLIYFLAVHYSRLYKYLEFLNKSEQKEVKTAHFVKSVNRFKEKFGDKTKAELEKIVQENELIPEAIEAAKQLLKER